MKKRLIILALLALMPILIHAAWLGNQTRSNGTTPVTIVAAPASSYSRTVPANGGIKICNTSSGSVTGWIQQTGTTYTNVLETNIVFQAGQTYWNEWVTILSDTNSSVEFVGESAFGSSLHITTHYRDEAQ